MAGRPTPEVAHLRARTANAVLRGDEQAAAECRRDLAAAKLEAYIRGVVNAAPPLTAEQCARLVALLRPDGVTDGAA